MYYDDPREEIFDSISEGRFDDAAQLLAEHLEYEPDDAAGFALRGVCLAEMHAWDEAAASVRHALRLDPGLGYAHWALAYVLAERNDFRAALAPAREAVRLDPEDPDSHTLLARVEASLGKWDDALRSTSAALAADPEHPTAKRLRGLILQHRGRPDEADSAFLDALIHDPRDAFAYAGRGWSMLRSGGDTRDALAHFQEALRLEPGSEWAREGLVAALKARNPVYRLMLRYFLWMSTLSPRVSMMIMIGGLVGYNVLRRTAAAQPELAPFIRPILVVYLVFLVLTWTADALFDSLLRLSPAGRAALTPDRVRASNTVLGTLAVAGSLAVGGLVLGSGNLLAGALVFGFLVLPVAGAFQCDPGWPRLTMGALCAVAALLGVVGMALPGPAGGDATFAAILVIVASTWLNQWLSRVTPRRK